MTDRKETKVKTGKRSFRNAQKNVKTGIRARMEPTFGRGGRSGWGKKEESLVHQKKRGKESLSAQGEEVWELWRNYARVRSFSHCGGS